MRFILITITRFALVAVALVLLCHWAQSQARTNCPVMPAGTLCITQAAGNQAAENVRELAAQKEKIAALEASVAARDQSIKELQAANTKNVADLTDRLHKTENDLAEKTGELVKAEAQHQDDRVTIQFLLTNGRKKCTLALICLP